MRFSPDLILLWVRQKNSYVDRNRTFSYRRAYQRSGWFFKQNQIFSLLRALAMPDTPNLCPVESQFLLGMTIEFNFAFLITQ